MNDTTTPCSSGPRLAEGQVVWNAGHEFKVTALKFYPDTEHPGYEVMRYTGVCTDDPCNDRIRHTGYNGGTYGYRVRSES